MARRPLRLATAALGLVLVVGALTGCSGKNEMTNLPKPPKAFCDAAAKYEASLTARKRPASLDTQIGLVREMDAAAPKDVADDTAIFLRSLEQVQGGDATAVDSPEVRDAVTNVNRRYSQGCGVYDRKGGI